MFKSRVIIIIFLGILLVACEKQKVMEQKTTSNSSPSSVVLKDKVEKIEPKTDAEKKQPDNVSSTTAQTISGWAYEQSQDTMRGTVTKYAVLKSTNKLDFSFPYNGGSTAELVIFGGKSNRYYVNLDIDKGQFLQRRMWFKFDNGPVLDSLKFGDLSVHEDGSADTVSIAQGNTRGFVQKIDKSSRLTIEAEFYKDGKKQIEFDVAGLDLAKLK